MSNSNFWIKNISAPFGGFTFAYWANSNPSFGNANMAGAMVDCDMTDPNVITQGLGIANLTNGTQAAAVTTLIRSIMETPVSSGVTYAIGGAKLYQVTTGAVTNAGIWPHTIDKAAVTGEDGEDVVEYQGALYYSYNHSGSGGDIGKYDLSSTFDDDWGSTVPSGAAALENAPHPMCHGGDDNLYIGNKNFVASYDGTTLDTEALDIPTDYTVADIVYMASRVVVACNAPNVANNSNQGIIYWWDGVNVSWDDYPLVKINGRIGSIFIKNGMLHVFYEENGQTDAYKLGVLQGNSVVEVASFSGSLPLYYQKALYRNFSIWSTNGLIYAYGSRDRNIKPALFNLMDGGYATVGGIAAPFGNPYVASWDASTNYKIVQSSGYSTTAYWKSIEFNASVDGGRSIIDKIIVHYEATATGAGVTIKVDHKRGTVATVGTITHTSDSGTIKKVFTDVGIECDVFRLFLDWSNGSATNPVKIRNIEILAHKINEF